jgi:hypothetical protein
MIGTPVDCIIGLCAFPECIARQGAGHNYIIQYLLVVMNNNREIPPGGRDVSESYTVYAVDPHTGFNHWATESEKVG